MNNHFEERLYGLAKDDRVKVWEIEVSGEEACAEIRIRHSVGENAQAVEHREVLTEGKNQGKSNQTTPLEQAVSQAQSRVALQKDRGYQYTPPTPGERNNALGLPMPMLATPLEKTKPEHLGERWYVQPKLDGFRALALMDEEGEVHLYTRRGKLIDTLHELKAYYQALLQPGEHLDGELYCHGRSLQNIASLVKRRQEETPEILHYVYDMVSEHPYEERLARVAEILYRRSPMLAKPVSSVQSDSMEHTQEVFERYRDEGFEGAILRPRHGPYEVGARSKTLIKLKAFEDQDYEILDVEPGKPCYLGEDRYEVGVFVFRSEKGHEFRATAPGTRFDKHLAYVNADDYLGQMCEIRFANKIAKTGVPFHGVAVKVKDTALD